MKLHFKSRQKQIGNEIFASGISILTQAHKFYYCEDIDTSFTFSPVSFISWVRLNILYFFFSALLCVSLNVLFPCCMQYFSLTKQAWGCGSVNMCQQDRFVSNLDKSGQTHNPVSLHYLQHKVLTFTAFSFVLLKKQTADNISVMHVRSIWNYDPSLATISSLTCVFTSIRSDGSK